MPIYNEYTDVKAALKRRLPAGASLANFSVIATKPKKFHLRVPKAGADEDSDDDADKEKVVSVTYMETDHIPDNAEAV